MKGVKLVILILFFTKQEDTEKSLSANNTLLEGKHLRVDLASNSKVNDAKSSIFIGNVPFDAEVEDLRKHFESCGEIINVRVIRDPKTNIGKGFAYIRFKNDNSIKAALRIKDKFHGRELRISKAKNSPKKLKHKKDKKQSNNKDLKPISTSKDKSIKSSNSKTRSWEGEHAEEGKLPNLKRQARATKFKKIQNNKKKARIK